MTLVVNNSSAGVKVDWGDGQQVSYTNDTITAPIKGTTITLTGGQRLTFLGCAGNRLTAVDLTQATALTSLYCANNELTALDLTRNTELADLNCANNKIETLSVTKNKSLANLDASNNQLTKFTGIASLQTLDLSSNALTSLSVASSKSLDFIDFSNNQLSTVTLGSTALTTVIGSNNALTKITFPSSGLTDLVDVVVANNQLTTLKLDKSASLKGVYCANNQLSQVAFSADLTKMDVYDCVNNYLGFNSLPSTKYAPTNFNYAEQGTFDISDLLEAGLQWKPNYVLVSGASEDAVKSIDLDAYRCDMYGNNISWIRFYSVTDGVQTKLTDGTDYKNVSGVITFLKPFNSVVCQFEPMSNPYKKDNFIVKTAPFAVYAQVADGVNDVVSDATQLNVAVSDGVLTLSAGRTTDVKIFTVAGKLVWKGSVGTSGVQVRLDKGVYVVNDRKVSL